MVFDAADTPDTETQQDPRPKSKHRESPLMVTNLTYIQHQTTHRNRYSPSAEWYQWQPRKTGKDKLIKQNDKAYQKHVEKIPGLHELHGAEELHRFHESPVYYQDREDKIKIDPAIPPMGDQYNFHGSKWKGEKFNQMWQFWVKCYPSHAHDIQKEMYRSRHEGREAWWNMKNQGWMVEQGVTGKRDRTDDIVGRPEITTNTSPTELERRSGHFERTYLRVPCQICGSWEHPALKENEDEYGDVRYKYICPISLENTWETWYMRPCPLKMAAICEYDEYQVLKLWHRICNDGWGQYQCPRILRLYLNMATKACKEKERMGTIPDGKSTKNIYHHKEVES